MSAIFGVVTAHQGGWDEVVLVAAPLSLFAGLLYLANRRADHVVQTRRDDEPTDDERTGDGD